LNTTLIIDKIDDTSILYTSLLSSLFIIKTIPNIIPIIPAIRLPIENILVNKIRIIFQSLLIMNIDKLLSIIEALSRIRSPLILKTFKEISVNFKNRTILR
jgi:hypothetical protein